MKVKLLSILFFISVCAFAQNNDIWTAFYNPDTDDIGFKNSKGEVMIKPRFRGLISARKFDKIIALMDDENFSRVYYMLKNGKTFGKDSTYIFDMTFDCESEGFIRFHDSKTDKVGMFNHEGKIVIPAKYSDLFPVKNGMTIALQGAHKEYWEKHNEHSGCNHWSWVSGKNILINTKNEILVEDFPEPKSLDIYSLKVIEKPIKDENRINILGKNGKYYSFVDNEKLFKNFIEKLIKNLNKENLLKNSYKEIVYWDEEKGWISAPAKDFIERNYSILSERLKAYFSKKDYQLSDYTPLTEKIEKEFEHHYNNCDERDINRFPIFNLIISYYEKGKFSHQDHFNFIKTEEGIQFISCTIRNHTLK